MSYPTHAPRFRLTPLSFVVLLLTLLMVGIMSSPVTAVGFNGHTPTTSIGYFNPTGTHARTYTVAPNMRQSASSPAAARSEIRHNEEADVYVNFIYNTFGDSVYLVYTNDGSVPNQSNGNVVNATFSHQYMFGGEDNRTWFATIPGQSANTNVEYVFYISNNTLGNAYARISPNGYETGPWNENDNGFQYTVQHTPEVIIDNFTNRLNTSRIEVFADGADEEDGYFGNPGQVLLSNLPALRCVGNTVTPGNNVGGNRRICLNVTSAPVGSSSQWQAQPDPTTGQYLSLALPPAVSARGTAMWDGAGGTSSSVNEIGLRDVNGLGLVLSGSANEGIGTRIVFADPVATELTLRAYTDANNWSEQTILFDTQVQTGQAVDIFFMFGDFTQGSGATGPADFNNIGALQLEVDGTLPGEQGADVTFKTISATRAWDYGDAADSYDFVGATFTPARHRTINTLRLGNSVSSEAQKTAIDFLGELVNIGTSLSPNNVQTDDGVARPELFKWNSIDGGQLTVTINGCTVAGGCRLNGWIDWVDGGGNGTGLFTDAGNQIFNDLQLANGTHTLNVTVPDNNLHSGFLNARFRLCSNAGVCNTPTGDAADGEVEDYRWEFGPLAVTLGNSQASSPVGSNVALPIVAVVLFALTGLSVYAFRRPTQG